MLDFAKLRDLKCFFILNVFALNLFISKVLDFFFFLKANCITDIKLLPMEYCFLILLRDFCLLMERPKGILKAQRSEWKLFSFDFYTSVVSKTTQLILYSSKFAQES